MKLSKKILALICCVMLVAPVISITAVAQPVDIIVASSAPRLSSTRAIMERDVTIMRLYSSLKGIPNSVYYSEEYMSVRFSGTLYRTDDEPIYEEGVGYFVWFSGTLFGNT